MGSGSARLCMVEAEEEQRRNMSGRTDVSGDCSEGLKGDCKC